MNINRISIVWVAAFLSIAFAPTRSVAIDEGCSHGACHGKMGKGKSVHEALDGCGDCHAETDKEHFPGGTIPEKIPNTAGDFKLAGKIPNVCYGCHDDAHEGNDNIHPPYDDGECLECHNPHQSDTLHLLRKPVPQLCFGCHDEMEEHIGSVRNSHPALEEDEPCLICHSPHAANPEYLLKAKTPMELCAKCHDDITDSFEGVAASKLHGPIQDGKCNACHNPHGSNYESILQKNYTPGNYAAFNRNNYQLCFAKCHDPEKFKEKGKTGFSTEQKNLHLVHVNRTKGRVCRFCHEPHVSGNDHLLRNRVKFGRWEFGLNWKREAESGASCDPGCHRKQTYSGAALPPVVGSGTTGAAAAPPAEDE